MNSLPFIRLFKCSMFTATFGARNVVRINPQISISPKYTSKSAGMNTKDKKTFKRGRKSPRNTVKPVEKNPQAPKTPGNEEVVDESGSLYSKM
ncbi:517_t:CDS:2, partial [Dentiscutata heterogama]